MQVLHLKQALCDLLGTAGHAIATSLAMLYAALQLSLILYATSNVLCCMHAGAEPEASLA